MATQGPSPPPSPPSNAPASGGTVEPANRSVLVKQLFQGPRTGAEGPRYELKDPFAEVTYRSTIYQEITDKADRLGSSRITAVAADGRKSRVDKADGRWPPEPGRAGREAAPDLQAAAKVVPITREAAGPVKAPPPAPSAAPPKSTARSEREARIAAIEAALAERYAIKRAPVRLGDLQLGRTEYHFRGEPGRLAFSESTFKLATDTNNPSVARSMVDVAEARGWKALRVNGNEDFRRMVWMEASVRGVKAVGYEPTNADQELLRREREARQVNRIEPLPAAPDGDGAASPRGSGRGGGGRKAVLAAIEAGLIDRKVPEAKREAILAASVEQLLQRARTGRTPGVKVYDAAAPSQRTPAPSTPEATRQRDRPAPSR